MRKVLALVAGVALLSASPAIAGKQGEAFITRGFRGSGVETEARLAFTSTPQAESSSNEASSAASESNGSLPKNPLVGQVLCGHDPRWAGGLTCALPPPEPVVADRGDRPRRESPNEVARRLADRAIALAPKPKLRLAPRGVGLTGLTSYFWLAERPQPISARAGVRGVVVTAEARPVQYVWTFGDGVDRVTRGPGRRWTQRRPGTVGHMYETRSRYRVLVEVIWQARWRFGRGAWRHLGYFSNSDSRRYRVREVLAVLVAR